MDQPPVEDLGIELPIEAVRNLTECQRMLQEAVTAGTFTVSVSQLLRLRERRVVRLISRFLKTAAAVARTSPPPAWRWSC